MKKILILNASPRKGGNVWTMSEALSDEYKSRGFEVETVDVPALKFHNCTVCMNCRTTGKCVFTDDATVTGEKISEADIIAVASPVWWGNMPGHLKALFDRNVYRFMGETKNGMPVPLMKGKKGIIISSCTTPFPFNWLCGETSGLKRAVNEVFKYGGIRLVKFISRAGTKKNK